MKPFIALSHDELRSLIVETVKAGDTRCHVLFLLCVCHGLRITEALTLERGNFSTVAGRLFITVARLKGSEETTQEVTSHADPLLNELSVVTQYLSQLQGDKLFDLGRSGADWLMKRYGKRAGVPEHKCHMHTLKHSLGNFMRRAGADVVQIKNALGHADIRSTMAYLRPTSDEIEEARITALGGRALAVGAATGR